MFLLKICAIEAQSDYSLCKSGDSSDLLYGFYCENFPFDNCTNRSILISKPYSIYVPPNMYVQNFKFNKCNSVLIAHTLADMDDVIVLDLSDSRYETLTWLNLTFQHLEKFNVSHNKLMEIPETLFNRTQHLIECDFSFNQLQNITAKPFAAAIHLRKIHLSNNQIHFVDSDLFVNLTRLEWVDLRNNRIRSVFHGNSPYHDPVSFRCQNAITNIKDIYYVSLLISWSTIEILHLNCPDNEYKVIRMGNSTDLAPTEGIFSTSVQNFEIHCADDSFQHIDEIHIDGQLMVTNPTDLIGCMGSSIRKIFITGSYMDVLNASQFHRFINLEQLRLKAAGLRDFFDFSILPAPDKLTWFDISDNGLNHLENIDRLTQYNRLQFFFVSGNYIENITHIIPYLSSTVKILRISDNFLGCANFTAISRIDNLRTLNVSRTNLSCLDFRALIKSTPLFSLDVSYNDLKSVDFSVEPSTLQTIQQFYAIDCQIANASQILQYFGSKLRKLDLSGNDFGAITIADAFKRFKNLELLHLNNANIVAFDLNALRNHGQLADIDLSDNNLREINVVVLPRQLKRLNLCGNDLSDLGQFNHTDFDKLNVMGMSDNQFSCEYLQQFKMNFSALEFIGDPFEQKHGKECRLKFPSTTLSNEMDLETATPEISTWHIYVVIIIGGCIFVGVAVWVGYKYSNCLFETITNRYQSQPVLSYDLGPHVLFDGRHVFMNPMIQRFIHDSYIGSESQIYESLPNLSSTIYEFDHLNSIPRRSPISITDQHYHNFTLPTGPNSRRNRNKSI